MAILMAGEAQPITSAAMNMLPTPHSKLLKKN